MRSDCSPIFVVGAPRSGTTLMGKILNQHHQVFVPGESHYFEDIWLRQHQWGVLENEENLLAVTDRVLTLFGRFNFPDMQRHVTSILSQKVLVRRTQALGGGYDALYQAFMAALAESAGKTRFGDDTPKHLYHLETIFAFFPKAKVIGCVRDPRDFLCSYKNYWRRSTESDRVKALYHPILTTFVWRSASNLLLKQAARFGPERMILVRYETLVQEPLEAVRQICNFLSLDFSSDLIKVKTNNSSFASTSPGIFTTSVERWRTCLEPEEVGWTQILASRQMNAFGHEIEPVNVSGLTMLITLIKTPYAFARALRANTAKRGPMLGYLLQRLSALLQR